MVRHCRTGHAELQDEVARSRRLDGGLVGVNRDRGTAALGRGAVLGSPSVNCCRSLTVDLVQPVLQIERLAGKVGEVNNHLHALGHSYPDTVHLNRMRDKVAVRANQEEWVGGGRTHSTYVASEEELKETGWPSIQKTEAVAAR